MTTPVTTSNITGVDLDAMQASANKFAKEAGLTKDSMEEAGEDAANTGAAGEDFAF